jgi:WD40 repeat protein
MKNVIDDITEYDAIYRSDGPSYVVFRRHFLKKFEGQLNTKFRENTYLPLRILLLETTRSRAKHSLNDLWLLLHSRRFKAPSILSIPSVSDSDIIPWQQMCAAMTAPGPVSCIKCTPFSRERFAFSTIDGSIHFATTANLSLRITSSVSIPGVTFIKFDWVSETLVVGIGVTSSLFFLSCDSRLFELPMPSPPSEVARFSISSSIVVVGDRSGQLYSLDLADLNPIHQCDGSTGFKQPTSTTISKIDPSVNKFHNMKQPITALCVQQSGECIICGTSDGNIDIVFVEQKNVRGWKGARSELKTRSVVSILISDLLNTKPASIDSLATTKTPQGDFVFVNLRSEYGALLISEDGFKHTILKKSVRVPSTRARCPAAMTSVNGQWMWVVGTDMGDLILQESGEEQTILTLHETTITAVEWSGNIKRFIAADVSGLISLWTKT